MKANGRSGSALFSARLKCTRPTRFQAGLRLLSQPCRSPPASSTAWPIASPRLRQRSRSTSAVMYSPPVISGAVNTRLASADASGSATAPRQRPSAYRPANARHHTSAGGKTRPTSPAPSCASPRPLLMANASVRRAATASSSAGACASASSSRRPFGVSRNPRQDMRCARPFGWKGQFYYNQSAAASAPFRFTVFPKGGVLARRDACAFTASAYSEDFRISGR